MALDTVTTLDASAVARKIAAILVETDKYVQAAVLVDATGAPITSANPSNVTLATIINPIDDSIQTMPIPGRAAFVHKVADYSSAATAALWTPTSTYIAVVTEIFVEWSGSTDGTIQVWTSTSSTADTTYTSGTDRLLFQIHATPSTKGSGGYSRATFFPGKAADYPILVTRSAAIACTVALSGFETQ